MDHLINTLNTQHPNIKFTYEKEQNGKLAFLDVILDRNNDKRIDVAVYRKSTNTDRFITNDSFVPKSTKMSAISSMVYRMCRLPLSIVNYIKELNEIKRIAKVNGYSEQSVMDLVEKHSKNIKKRSKSTFFNQQKSDKTRTPFNFIPDVTNKLKPILKKVGIEMALSNNNNKLSNLLGNTKDKVEYNQQSGIYTITCSHCGHVYVGQTRRAVEKRYKEHMAHTKYYRTKKSAVAHHIWEKQHYDIDINNLRLVKQIRRQNQLDIWESIYMRKYKDKLMNIDPPPINSFLLNMIT